MINEYKLSDVAQNEMKSFATYTIESRAIPNMIDGLKPVQRFYLYSSIVNTPKDYKKVSAVSGVVSDFGYNHGEASAAGAGQLMAATWNNNICLVEGRGSFGTRQVPEAGAARYVYTRLHTNFYKYIKDIELSPAHIDPEHEPPSFYIPVIPLVLANGARGIATGFATNILPRSEKALIKASKDYIKTGSIKNRLPISFPDFKGTVEYDSVADRFVCRGVYERVSKTVVKITEIPYGIDRESYIKILDKLEDDDLILTYDDQCSDKGFEFEVKLKQAIANKLTDDKLIKMFKLEKTFSENLTVIGHDLKLKEYTDERDLIRDFCDYRLGILQKRIDRNIEISTEKCRWLNVKMDFIKAVLEDQIVFKNKGKDEVIQQMTDLLIPLVNDDGDRLLRMNILSLTKEMVKTLLEELKSEMETLKYWKETTANDQFLSDLDNI